MKYSVCIDALYGGQDFLSAMEQIKAEGFDGFEFWSWWDKDVDAIVKKASALGLQVVGLCTKFVSLVNPALRDSYLAGLQETIQVAQKMGCHTIITQVGDDTGAPRAEQMASLIEGLKQASVLLEQTDIRLVVEPLNIKIDHKGYFLFDSAEAFAIIRAVGSDHVKLLFDFYHQQITEGDLLGHLLPNLDLVGHLHGASVPNRQELFFGEIHYKNLMTVLDQTAYQGRLGLEYMPKLHPAKGLQWLQSLDKA